MLFRSRDIVPGMYDTAVEGLKMDELKMSNEEMISMLDGAAGRLWRSIEWGKENRHGIQDC